MNKTITLPTYAEATLDGFPLISYMEIVCCIPKGKLVTKNALLSFVSAQLGHKYTRIASNGWFVPNMRADMYADSGYAFREYQSAHPHAKIPSDLLIPYWRVVSSEGIISHNKYDNYSERLTAEGFTISEDGKVSDYESHLYDFKGITVTAPKLGKFVKSETYKIFGRIGDPIYRVVQPDYMNRFEKVMKFRVEHDPLHDRVEAITISSEGIQYFYDSSDKGSYFSPNDLVFFSKAEATAYIEAYCSGFNDKKYKFRTPIYTQFGEETIERAKITHDHEICFVTKKGNEYFIKDENITFSFDREFIRRYLIAKTTMNNGMIVSSESLGEYIGIAATKKAMKKLQKKYSAAELENGDLCFSDNGMSITIHLVDKGVM